MNIDKEIDTRGLNCPLPILKTKKALNTMTSGQTIRVLATDPSSMLDFKAFAAQTGHELLAFIERIDAGHFAMYQAGIREFLASPAARRFTNAHWCETLVTTILADIQQA